jgi:phosphatidylglycerophosphate synthase
MSGPLHPTLAELRTRVHKGEHRAIGNWLARRVARPTAVYGTWLAIRLGLSAHQVTLLALASSGAAVLALMTGSRWGFVAGVALAHLAFWLDHVDGQVARWRGTASLDGVYFDYLMHHVANLGLGFALGYGLAAQSGDLRWAAAGFAIALGWAALGLHNDCRYKAFFQRLKRETGRFRVEGGSGLTALAVAALLAPAVWIRLWGIGVATMAGLAPLLAFGRAARAIKRQTVSAEFDRWFRPLDTPPRAGTMRRDQPATGRPTDVDLQQRPHGSWPLAGDARTT